MGAVGRTRASLSLLLIVACAVPSKPKPPKNDAEVAVVSPSPVAAPSVRFCDMDVPLTAKELECDGESITDLAPLARLGSLEKLSLRFTRVTDVSPLAGLSHLRELEIAGCRQEEWDSYECYNERGARPSERGGPPPLVTPLEDISPLANLRELQSIRLDSTLVTDLAPLSGLAKLRALHLFHTPATRLPALPKSLEILEADSSALEDIEGLRDLPRLETLSLWSSRARSVDALEHDTALRTLRVSGSLLSGLITSLEGLSKLSGLTSLSLSEMDAVDLAPLANMSALTKLHIKNSGVLGIAPLANLKQLAELELDATRWTPGSSRFTEHGKNDDYHYLPHPEEVIDLVPLGGLRELRTLSLAGRPGSLAPLAKLTKLEQVTLGGGPESYPTFDLAHLRNAKNLSTLDIEQGQPSRLADIGALTSLEELRLVNATVKLRSTTALSKLVRLKKLHIGDWTSFDFSHLEAMSHLETLEVTAETGTSLASIGKLLALRDLTLGIPNLSKLDPVGSLVALRSLNLRKTRVTDLGPLRGLSELRSFEASALLASDLGPLARLESLQSLTLANAPNVKSLEALRSLTTLRHLSLADVPVSDLGPLASLPELRSLELRGLASSPGDEAAISKKVNGCSGRHCGAWAVLRAHYRRAYR